MPALYLVTPRASGGGQISAADTNQLVNTLTGNQNTPVSIKNTDPIAYTLQLQNTDAAGKALLIYGPDGTTVLNRVQGNGVVASPDGTAAAPVVTTTHTQTLTNKTFTAPHLTAVVVDSGGLQVAVGNVGIGQPPQTDRGLYIGGLTTITTGTVQYGIVCNPSFSSAATVSGDAVYAQASTQAAAFTLPVAADFHAYNPVKGAGSTITSAYGLLVDAITSGNTNNYGVNINTPSGGSGSNIGLVVAGGNPAVQINAGGITIGGDPGSKSGIGYTFTATAGIGNGVLTNIQAPLLGTGSGPAAPTSVANWIKIYDSGGAVRWIPYMA